MARAFREEASASQHQQGKSMFEGRSRLMIRWCSEGSSNVADHFLTLQTEYGTVTKQVSVLVLHRRRSWLGGGAKFVHDTAGGSDHSYITVYCCGSASGTCFVPYILFKGVDILFLFTCIRSGPLEVLLGHFMGCLTPGGWRPRAFLTGSRKGSCLLYATCSRQDQWSFSLMGIPRTLPWTSFK